MITSLPVIPWCTLMLDQTQKCHNLAWFLYGCAQREHVLNMDAWVTWWARAFTVAPSSPRRMGAQRFHP